MQWSSISSRWAGVNILISFGQVVAHLSHFSCLRVISCKNSRTWLRSCNVICPLQRCWAWALTWGHGHTRHPWVPCSTARTEDVTDRWAASRASSSASASVWLKKKGFSVMPLIQSGFKTWKSVSALLHVIQCVCAWFQVDTRDQDGCLLEEELAEMQQTEEENQFSISQERHRCVFCTQVSICSRTLCNTGKKK